MNTCYLASRAGGFILTNPFIHRLFYFGINSRRTTIQGRDAILDSIAELNHFDVEANIFKVAVNLKKDSIYDNPQSVYDIIPLVLRDQRLKEASLRMSRSNDLTLNLEKDLEHLTNEE